MDATGKALVDHWSWAAQKGLINKNSAGAIRAACAKVLSTLDDWESVNINDLDIDDVISRFENLKAQEIKPQTLDAYGKRFRRAVQSFQDFVRDPKNWRFKSNTTSSGRSQKKSEPKPPKPEDSAGEERNAIVEPTGLVEYPFPLRQDFIANLKLPNDLTSDEVKRLHIFMQALVVEF